MSTVTADNGAGTAEARVIFPYETTDRSRNIVHELINGDIALTVLAPLPQSGTLTYEVATESAAMVLRDLHRQRSTFTLTVPERPMANMTYVVTGDARLQLHESGQWTLAVGYQAVSA